jgi:hypothetical protein
VPLWLPTHSYLLENHAAASMLDGCCRPAVGAHVACCRSWVGYCLAVTLRLRPRRWVLRLLLLLLLLLLLTKLAFCPSLYLVGCARRPMNTCPNPPLPSLRST